MHSVPFALPAYKFILMLIECIYFEVSAIAYASKACGLLLIGGHIKQSRA